MAEEIVARQREIGLYIEHADEMLRVAAHNLVQGFYSTAVNRAYYAIFYTANALLATQGLSRGKHSGVIAAFRQYFVKPGLIEAKYSRTYGRLMDDRHGADYDLETDVEPEQAAVDVENARQFVARVKLYLQREEWL
ncbi:MAG TPA: HEPN domain-containing protein [Caldilineae bacterium]|nr:HEPN domain-containing protein [Caldilineae bacterium]